MSSKISFVRKCFCKILGIHKTNLGSVEAKKCSMYLYVFIYMYIFNYYLATPHCLQILIKMPNPLGHSP